MKAFFDTNVLVYLYSNDDVVKKAQALSVVSQSSSWISTQVLTEYGNVAARKLRLPWADVAAALLEFQTVFAVHHNTPATIVRATRLAQRYGFSWFDALIVAAALDCNCPTLYTEDLQHGQLLEDGRLQVLNPFR